jgi:HK97 family phage major capsid protein
VSIAILEQRNAAVKELKTLGDKPELSEAEEARFGELETEIARLDAVLDRNERAAALTERTAPVQQRGDVDSNGDVDIRAAAKPTGNMTVRESSPYGEKSDKSWFVDQHTVRSRYSSDSEVAEARERLVKHYAAVADEGGARQARALSTTTDSEGGYLVAPAHVQGMFARYLVAGAPCAALVSKIALPPKTDQINLPKQDGATAVALHTQNNALTETSATFTTVQINALRYGGAQTIPNFLLERSLPGIDAVVMADLGRQLAYKINTDIVGATGNGLTGIEGILSADSIGTATATAGTATWGDVYPAIVNAVADVQAAHYASPDAILMHPRRWAWILSQVDADDRPLVGVNGMGMNPIAGYGGPVAPNEADALVRPVGSLLGIPVYVDSSIPTTNGAGTDEDRIIVGVFKEAMLFHGAPQFAVSTEAEFLKDQTLVRVTQDIAFTAERYPGAFSVVSGTALNDL